MSSAAGVLPTTQLPVVWALAAGECGEICVGRLHATPAFGYKDAMKALLALPTVLTGIKPTGVPTLGSLLGFFQPALSFQASHNAYYFVVDHHAITVRQQPADLLANTRAIAAWYLAAGLNPAKATLFVQSHVPAHVELGWILTTFTQMGELERMTQYKDKSRQHAQGHQGPINAGLFNYPVLQAADILLYHATEVPVGDDQKQHVELCRDIALRFNGIYGPVFTVPKHSTPPHGARVRDLQDPAKKMSKSLGGQGCVLLTDSVAEVEKKFKRAVTDSDSGAEAIRYLPDEKPGVANLLEIIAGCATNDMGTTPQAVAAQLAGQNYGALKQAAADAVNTVLQPLQAAQATWLADTAGLDAVLAAGAIRANAVATPTLMAVKNAMGYLPAAR
jgi:tryptophanyl-tRNA synthetase